VSPHGLGLERTAQGGVWTRDFRQPRSSRTRVDRHRAVGRLARTASNGALPGDIRAKGRVSNLVGLEVFSPSAVSRAGNGCAAGRRPRRSSPCCQTAAPYPSRGLCRLPAPGGFRLAYASRRRTSCRIKYAARKPAKPPPLALVITATVIALSIIVAVLGLFLRGRGKRESSEESASAPTTDKLDTTLGEFHDMREALRPLQHTRAASRWDPRKADQRHPESSKQSPAMSADARFRVHASDQRRPAEHAGDGSPSPTSKTSPRS
jgi:multisubunit Na+/H+ antiporter MnhC subunit